MISYIDVLPHVYTLYIGMDKTNDQTGSSNNMFYNEDISMCRNQIGSTIIHTGHELHITIILSQYVGGSKKATG